MASRRGANYQFAPPDFLYHVSPFTACLPGIYTNFCMIFLMLCINIILRKRWAEGEKLAFPIVQLPLAMTDGNGRRFFSSRIMWLGFYPFAIGLGFLLPLDLSFSCWFFYVLGKAVRIFGRVAGLRVGGVGWSTWPVFPYFNEQASGAWVGLCILQDMC